jgi:hypothetical protein
VGFKLGEEGGIRMVIAAEQPPGIPEGNWLPKERTSESRRCAMLMQRWLLTISVICLFVGVYGDTAWAQESAPGTEPEAQAGEPDEQLTAEEGAAGGDEPEPQSSFETTVDFTTGAPITLGTQVGNIDVRSIELSTKAVKKGFMAKPFASGNEDLQSEVIVMVNLATAAGKRQKIGILVELLDGKQVVIDRAGNNFGLKDGSKIVSFKFTTLTWALDRVEGLKLHFEARN